MRRIFYLVCLLIVYGSLYPFHFVWRDSPAGAFQALAASLHLVIDRGFLRDVLLNLLVYVPVGFFFVLDERPGRPVWLRCLRAALAGAALSFCMEFLQYWFPPRNPSLVDLFDNTLSAAAGGLLGILFAARARHAVDLIAGFARPSSALFLTLVWAAALFSPGDWGAFHTVSKLRAFLASPLPAPGVTLIALAQWIGIGALAAAIAGRARAPLLLFAFAVALPLRFAIPGQHPRPAEFAAAALAVVIWYAPQLGRRLGASRIALLLAAALLLDALRPWHFASLPGRFELVPFLSLLEMPWNAALLILLSKAAIYGTVVWAVARAGLGIPLSTALVSVLLAATEALQVFLPGRTAETTDPLLALIMGLILLSFDLKYGRDPGPGAPLPLSLSPDAGRAPAAPASHTLASAPGPRVWTGGRRSGL